MELMPGLFKDKALLNSLFQAFTDSDDGRYLFVIDEQTGEAGFITRLEAFVDMLFRKKRAKIINKIEINGDSSYIPNTNYIETKH